MNYEPTITTESASCPGVTFAIHRMGVSRRTRIELETAELRQASRELNAEYLQKFGEKKFSELTPKEKPEEETLRERLTLQERQIEALWVRAGLMAIHGGDVDGMTAEQLCEFGPKGLFADVSAAIFAEAYPRAAEIKNSLSPTISGARDQATNESTNAPFVEARPEDGTPGESASTTQAAN